MKGYTHQDDLLVDPLDDLAEDSPLPPWQLLVINAVGTVIEFWGFKRNQGKVWALLYLYQRPMTAAQIREALQLSKGAASMLLREIEAWGVIHRVRVSDSQAWHFVAEIDLFRMIGRVFRKREVAIVERVKDDLTDAERLARDQGDVPEAMLERLVKMRKLAGMIEHALKVFLSTARLDVGEIEGIFDHEDHASSQDE